MTSASMVTTADAGEFTSKERDSETGLDFFDARYLSSAQGRFTSADAPFNDQYADDPQSWNLYSYVRNNPLRFVDPTGRCSQAAGGGYTDEGKSLFPGPCSGGTIGDSNNNKNSTNVNDFEPPSPLLLAVAQGTQRASRDISTAGILMIGTGTAVGGTFLIAPAGVEAGLITLGGRAALAGVTLIAKVSTKGEARDAIQKLALPAKQAAAATSAIARATASSTIEIVKEGQNIVVRISRAGADGFQTVESKIDRSGVKQVIQKAYSAAGDLVHYDPKN